ncbi:MAG: exo-alpha-sialidase [Dehalococcoidia bacterium]
MTQTAANQTNRWPDAAERSPITNVWGDVALHRPTVQERLVYFAQPGSAYNHHPQITSLDGRLFATWSNGYRDEDQLGQCMLIASSDDYGRSWSAPRPLVDRQPGERTFGVVTAEGVHVHDQRLVAYYGYYDTTYQHQLMYYATGGNANLADRNYDSYRNTHTGIVVSDDHGETWTGPMQVIHRFMPNLGPHRLASGRLILPGNCRFPWTDDPAGIEGWINAELPDLPEGYHDDPEGHVIAARHWGDGRHFEEGSCFEDDQGLVHMMMRTPHGRLAESISRDQGRTWSHPRATDYTDCGSRMQFGRLPDGRWFGLTCPQRRSPRTPLILAASRDGVRFDQHYVIGEADNHLARIPGVHKFGRYGYPSCHLLEGTLHVIYSINKEDIVVTSVDLEQLA